MPIPPSFIFMSLFFFNYQLREQMYISYQVLKFQNMSSNWNWKHLMTGSVEIHLCSGFVMGQENRDGPSISNHVGVFILL